MKLCHAIVAEKEMKIGEKISLVDFSSSEIEIHSFTQINDINFLFISSPIAGNRPKN